MRSAAWRGFHVMRFDTNSSVQTWSFDMAAKVFALFTLNTSVISAQALIKTDSSDALSFDWIRC